MAPPNNTSVTMYKLSISETGARPSLLVPADRAACLQRRETPSLLATLRRRCSTAPRLRWRMREKRGGLTSTRSRGLGQHPYVDRRHGRTQAFKKFYSNVVGTNPTNSQQLKGDCMFCIVLCSIGSFMERKGCNGLSTLG